MAALFIVTLLWCFHCTYCFGQTLLLPSLSMTYCPMMPLRMVARYIVYQEMSGEERTNSGSHIQCYIVMTMTVMHALRQTIIGALMTILSRRRVEFTLVSLPPTPFMIICRHIICREVIYQFPFSETHRSFLLFSCIQWYIITRSAVECLAQWRCGITTYHVVR